MPKTSGDGTPCPECGSVNTVKNGNIKKGRGTISRRKCNACQYTWYPTLQKNACKCGLLGCTCGGNLGRIITVHDDDEPLRSYAIAGYTLNLHNWRG